eukprot:TRINITY_DN40733_c0_g1_i1.p1 TRINITY_DN40733_c0_g1~~TRINITY_DN40733_c0_g1_i1.p1  ORF type:complete len:197 (-),score=45.34 TRINITY_DN40733_c0_g1_i1:464-1054(-)
MQLGASLWRSSGAGGACLLRKSVAELGLESEVRRSPWVLSASTREALEGRLGLPTDGFLSALAASLQKTAPENCVVAVGLSTSGPGDVYIGPSLALGARTRLSAWQALVANAFSHGAGGLSAVSAAEPPCKLSVDLLRELTNFSKMRWMEAASPSNGGGSSSSNADTVGRSGAVDGFGFGVGRAPLVIDVVGSGGG